MHNLCFIRVKDSILYPWNHRRPVQTCTAERGTINYPEILTRATAAAVPRVNVRITALNLKGHLII